MPSDQAINVDNLEIKKLTPEDDLTDFKCDLDDDLGCNDFIHRDEEAKKFQAEHQGITYLFYNNSELVGYVTVAMSSISAKRIDLSDTTGIHLSFYPCLLVGRLGVSNDYRKSGVGKYVLKWCVGMALDLSDTVGCRYISLETKESKSAFYSKCNFHKGTALDGDRYIWMYQKIAFE
jgi:GNAT superfamily N-acetyltransferase